MTLFTTVNGALDDLSWGKSRSLRGLTPGVRAGQHAFTLVELLFIIIIIAILAAVLMPVLLNKAKQTALTAQCLNNMKQLQTCYLMYVQDNNDNLPLNFPNPTIPGNWIQGQCNQAYGPGNADVADYNIRTSALFPYNQQSKIYVCPADTMMIGPITGLQVVRATQDGVNLTIGSSVPQVRSCSIEYSMGGNSAQSPAGPWNISYGGYTWNSYGKMSSILATRISQKIVFAQEAESTLSDGIFAQYPYVSTGPINNWWNLPANRHDNGENYSFADGRVEYWRWRDADIATYQNGVPGNGQDPATGLGDGGGSNYPVNGPYDDLYRVEAAAAQYP
jgi:prepilin-type processing-associated H-X9-DG protein